MTKVVDPAKLFARIARELPAELTGHLYVAGSLAAARHHADQLSGRGVRTKDADLVVHPGGDTTSAQAIALRLLANGWRRTDQCYLMVTPEPVNQLRAIRLYPPDHKDYFIELLIVPEGPSATGKQWLSVKLDDGWYGVPSFSA